MPKPKWDSTKPKNQFNLDDSILDAINNKAPLDLSLDMKAKLNTIPPIDLGQLARDTYRRGYDPFDQYSGYDPFVYDEPTYTKIPFYSIHGLYNLCRAEYASYTPDSEMGLQTLDKQILNLMSLNLKRPLTSIETKTVALRNRLELFNRIPSCANMILAFKLIEDIILETYKSSISDIDTRSVEKFDKLKNLALSTKYIHERKLAFTKSLEIFVKLTKVEGLN